MSNTDFAPFVPPAPMFEEGKPAIPPPPVHEKKPRKKKKASGGKKAAAPAKKPPKSRKKRAAPVTAPVVSTAAPATKTRKLRQPRAPKFSLSEALEIGALLQPGDLKPFGQIEHDLRALSKGSRTRVLAAITRVFE